MSEICDVFKCTKKSTCISNDNYCEVVQSCMFLKSLGRCDLCVEASWCPLPGKEFKDGKPCKSHH